MSSKRTVSIETRAHLLSTLAEAAELEHDLLCMYLYSAFSLKTSPADGLDAAESEAVSRWRETILGICVEEMTHFALVANLTTAVGGGAHFFHPEFPVRPGYFPSDFVLELARFDEESLQHFIFLERPEDEPVEDASAFAPEKEYTRGSPRDRLMTHTGDYSTVGQLYQAIERGVVSLSSALGEKKLFCGAPSLQMGPADAQMKGLMVVSDGASASAALRLIVEQGEGARTTKGSHFEKFMTIAEEYERLRRANPGFEPSRPAARNPVMRMPAEPEGRVWVSETTAAQYLDVGNALYNFMLRLLVQVYSMENRRRSATKALLAAAFSLMHAIAAVGRLLTMLPANREIPGTTAGINFALERYFTPSELTGEKLLLVERVDEILEEVQSLRQDGAPSGVIEPKPRGEFSSGLEAVEKILRDVRISLNRDL